MLSVTPYYKPHQASIQPMLGTRRREAASLKKTERKSRLVGESSSSSPSGLSFPLSSILITKFSFFEINDLDPITAVAQSDSMGDIREDGN